jgi:hypothetical protein
MRAIDRFVLASFLPALSVYDTVDAIGASGGILTAWDPQFLSLDSSRRDRFSLSLYCSFVLPYGYRLRCDECLRSCGPLPDTSKTYL